MQIAIKLDEVEWGQALDGLRCRAEQYEGTVRYYESGYAESLIAEVRDEGEASALAALYREIIAKIENGLAGQTSA